MEELERGGVRERPCKSISRRKGKAYQQIIGVPDRKRKPDAAEKADHEAEFMADLEPIPVPAQRDCRYAVHGVYRAGIYADIRCSRNIHCGAI